MNPAHPNDDQRPDAVDASDASPEMKDRCLMYLLGELSKEQTDDFEQQLTSDSELNRELLIQSELLFALSCSAAKPQLANEAAPVVAEAASPGTWRTGWSTWIAALAACILVIVTGSQLLRDQSSENVGADEALLIAQAWAEGQSIGLDELAPATTGSDLTLSEGDSEPDGLFEETDDDESIPSWMVVAFAADEAGELGDG